MQMESYPYLEQLLGAYFHQDCYDDGATDEEIIEDFRNTSHDYQIIGARADILRLLNEHADRLEEVLQQIFQPNIIFGETNDEVRKWLLKILSNLKP